MLTAVVIALLVWIGAIVLVVSFCFAAKRGDQKYEAAAAKRDQRNPNALITL